MTNKDLWTAIIAVLVVLFIFAKPASSQQTSPTEQAIGNKLLQEIQSGLGCSAALITAQASLDKAQARIKELESKATGAPK